MQLKEKELSHYTLKISATLSINEDDLPVEPEDRNLNYELDEVGTDTKSIQRLVDEVSSQFDSFKNVTITNTITQGDDFQDISDPTASISISIMFTADEEPTEEDLEDLSAIIMDEFVDQNQVWVTGDITVDVDSYDPFDGEYTGGREVHEFTDYINIRYSDLHTSLTNA